MRFPNPWLGHVFSAWNKFILSGYEMFTSINVALNCYNIMEIQCAILAVYK